MGTWTPTGSGGSGGSSSYARVQLATAAITDWDGSTIPFNSVPVDADGLWDAPNHQFVPKVAGWYALRAYATRSGGYVNAHSVGAGIHEVFATVFGAGDNVYASVAVPANGNALLPALVGTTHLDVADAVVLQGDGGPSWTVFIGATFEIELVKAD